MGEPWFRPKKYGIGLSPSTRAGWIWVAVYGVAVAATPPLARQFAAPRWAIWLVLATFTVAFLVVMRIKSDRQPWRWRWGGR